MFWGKAKKVEELVLRHLKKVDESLASFEKALMAYVVEQDYSKAKKLALDTHVAEGKADDIRREVETRLLGGALLGLSAGYFWSFYLDNAGYSVFTCNDGKFTLVRWNEACHLGERTVERY